MPEGAFPAGSPFLCGPHLIWSTGSTCWPHPQSSPKNVAEGGPAPSRASDQTQMPASCSRSPRHPDTVTPPPGVARGVTPPPHPVPRKENGLTGCLRSPLQTLHHVPYASRAGRGIRSCACHRKKEVTLAKLKSKARKELTAFGRAAGPQGGEGEEGRKRGHTVQRFQRECSGR